MHHSVSVLIINDHDEILYHQRGDIKYWGLPGGMVEPGELPEAAAIRETKEETGLDVDIIRKIAEYERPHMPGGERCLHLYLAKQVAGELNTANAETAALRWATADQIPKRSNPYLQFYFQDYRMDRPGTIKRSLSLSWAWRLRLLVLNAVRTLGLGLRRPCE
jgi:8-oxo-dGTP diphosphatase